MDQTDLCYTQAIELSRLIGRRELSPVELTDAVLARIERLNPSVNAYLTVTADLAREQAKAAEARAMKDERIGPIDGIPYSLKDLEPTNGIRTTFGSKWFEDNVPTEDGAVAGRMKASGAVLLGKTNTSNFGYKDMGDNMIAPPTSNPWKLDRTSGASSAGAGASVAAGMSPLAHGSDGAGSIRIPASLCGIVGFKPSLGRIPSYPNADIWSARSHNGPMTRTVRDAAMMLQVMAGPDPRDPLSIDAEPDDYRAACDGDLKGLRVAFSADFGYAAVDPDVRAAFEKSVKRFGLLGCELEAKDPSWDDPLEFHALIYQVTQAGRQGDRFDEHPDWIEATLKQMIEAGRRFSGVDLQKANLKRTVFYHQARSFFESYDLLLTPQMPVGAWSNTPGPEEGPRQIEGRPTPRMFDRLPFTVPFNLTGQPAITVPCGFTSEGMPIGLQIVGRWHQDSTVLRAAAGFEAMQPWLMKRPPLD